MARSLARGRSVQVLQLRRAAFIVATTWMAALGPKMQASAACVALQLQQAQIDVHRHALEYKCMRTSDRGQWP